MQGKKTMAGSFGTGALVLSLTAAAWACTTFKGTYTVTGNSSTSGTVTATGNNKGMGYTSISSGIAKAKGISGTVTVSTGADAGGIKLAAGAYDINYYNSQSGVLGNGPGFSNHSNWNVDCMSPVGGVGGLLGGNGSTTVGGVTIDGNGNISAATGGTYYFPTKTATFALPTSNNDTSPGESAVCVNDSGGAIGNQAPVTIVSI